MRRSSRLVHLTACLMPALATAAPQSRPAPVPAALRVQEGRNPSHAVLVFGESQDPPGKEIPASAPASQPAADRMPGFDAAGWPERQEPQAAARRKLAIDPADQAFVDLANLVMDVQFTGLGEDGQELFQRRARLEMATLPGGEERLTFADGRVYERVGTRVQVTQGRLRRPDQTAEAEAWLDAVTWFVRMPHPTALGGKPRGPFDLLAQSGGARTDEAQVRTFGRGDERLHVFVDPATGGSMQTMHSPGEGQAERCVLLTEPIRIGDCRFPTVRTVLGPGGRNPVLVVRFSQVRVRGG